MHPQLMPVRRWFHSRLAPGSGRTAIIPRRAVTAAKPGLLDKLMTACAGAPQRGARFEFGFQFQWSATSQIFHKTRRHVRAARASFARAPSGHLPLQLNRPSDRNAMVWWIASAWRDRPTCVALIVT